MLDDRRITQISEGVVRPLLGPDGLERILTEPTSDSQGNDALRITVVLKPAAAEELSGDDALDLLVGIQNDLLAAGEERFPIVEYATEQELREVVDSDEGGA